MEEDNFGDGFIREMNGKVCIKFDGYWIRYYPPLEETVENKKFLINSLTKRVFHHTENGINTPGWRLDIARKHYEEEQDPDRRRVNAAMLAGALFNRASNIFDSINDLNQRGLNISQQNELMKECENCFLEALILGKQVKHDSGEEGVEELWGEPFKVFTMTIKDFYQSRYLKAAQTFRDVDTLVDRLIDVFEDLDGFSGLSELLNELRQSAKEEIETMRSDDAIFTVWPRYVAAREAVQKFRPQGMCKNLEKLRFWEDGLRLLNNGNNVVNYLVGVRVPMPVTLSDFLAQCDLYEVTGSLDSEFSGLCTTTEDA
ncbi:MAG: hypothetical protein ACRBHB_04205 [Arenicella sp.]